jgi:O-antigen/teichoic acid export membrane protein
MSNYFAYLLGAIIVKGVNVGLMPIYTRYLDPAEYGALELLGRATDLLLLCLFLNGNCLAIVTCYNQSSSDEQKRKIAGSALVFGFLGVAVVGGPAFALAGPISGFLGLKSVYLVRLAFLGAFSNALVAVCLALAQARLESMVYMAVTVALVVFRVLLIAVFVCLFRWGIQGILMATLLSCGMFAVGLAIWEVRRSGLHVQARVVRDMFLFALPFLPGGLCGFVIGSGDQFLMARYASIWDVGLYALGYKLAQLVAPFTTEPLMKIWSVRLHHMAYEPDAPRAFGRVFSRFALAYLCVGLTITMFSRDLLTVLSASRFVPAASYVAPVVLAYFFHMFADLMDAGFYIKRRTYWKLAITMTSAVVILLLYLVLIPRYRAMGAAYATLLGCVFRATLTYTIAQRLFPIVYEWGRVLAMLLLSLACWWISLLTHGSGWTAVPTKVFLVLIFLSILWQTGLVAAQEKLILQAFFEKVSLRFRSRVLAIATVPRDS